MISFLPNLFLFILRHVFHHPSLQCFNTARVATLPTKYRGCSSCRISYRQTLRHLPENWRSFIRWSPDQWVSLCYATECYYRSFYCYVSLWLVRVNFQWACALNILYIPVSRINYLRRADIAASFLIRQTSMMNHAMERIFGFSISTLIQIKMFLPFASFHKKFKLGCNWQALAYSTCKLKIHALYNTAVAHIQWACHLILICLCLV
jgi:hypothetical protein